jgi:hypothetical protein
MMASSCSAEMKSCFMMTKCWLIMSKLYYSTPQMIGNE